MNVNEKKKNLSEKSRYFLGQERNFKKDLSQMNKEIFRWLFRV